MTTKNLNLEIPLHDLLTVASVKNLRNILPMIYFCAQKLIKNCVSAMSRAGSKPRMEPDFGTDEEDGDRVELMVTDGDERFLDSEPESEERDESPPDPLPDDREERRKKRAALVARAKELIRLAELEDEKEESGRRSSLRSALPKGNDVSSIVENVEIKILPPANLSGAEQSLNNAANLSGAVQEPSNRNGDGYLEGQDDSVNSRYKFVNALKAGTRSNPSFSQGGGGVKEKTTIGSFTSRNDCRSELAHFRSVVESKLNLSFSFDPKSMLCSNCMGRGAHSVCGGGGECPTGIRSV
jgi:hypothetical protein